ncbi:alpha/beta fold hydrolase [Bdellovibrio sp. NC01]|uniref:alpha/beta fold hydrolase n=1 Tax=Bdellovibrio sp. NC01 TaxID=2220073 RepID=UPI0011590DE2|nr:alpha/beta hydrolase [Bdellovibrio sp. NC01]QDK38695.1 hypothetical protein DOE51_14430 [Bdellovibrio sp. NC01]
MAKEWVLIRGIMSEAYHWWDFLPQMQAHFPEDTFHTADIMGNGKLCAHTTSLSIPKNIAVLREQVPATSTKKILFGFSLGGMLALEWAHRHPEEVEAVVLLNVSLNNSPFYKRLRPSSFAQIFKSAFIKDLTARESMIVRMTTSNMADERVLEIAQNFGPRGVEYPVKPMNFLWQIGIASQIPQRQAPPAPVLVLNSALDKVVHPDCSKKIAEGWNLPLIVHPHAGHDLTLEDPQWVLEKVSHFVNARNV